MLLVASDCLNGPHQHHTLLYTQYSYVLGSYFTTVLATIAVSAMFKVLYKRNTEIPQYTVVNPILRETPSNIHGGYTHATYVIFILPFLGVNALEWTSQPFLLVWPRQLVDTGVGNVHRYSHKNAHKSCGMKIWPKTNHKVPRCLFAQHCNYLATPQKIEHTSAQVQRNKTIGHP